MNEIKNLNSDTAQIIKEFKDFNGEKSTPNLPDEDTSPRFKKKQVEGGVRQILLGMSIDLNDENFRETPARVARAFYELCGGLFVPEKKIEDIFGKKFSSPYKGLVMVGPVDAVGMCPHHLLPIQYKAVMAYIAGESGEKLGLSKLARAIRLYAKRPEMQETVSNAIIEAFVKYVRPAGVALWMAGRHGCMTSRGVNLPECQAITQDVRGLFETDVGVKTEFEHKLSNLGVDRA
jgi:GTP cyclohydrolase IA